tara:strand:- start:1376 stop:1741 length:366 start_codon:yes stop_codon:yes gene_type:complete
MANPNIAAATSIVGHTIYGSISNSLTEYLENAASSNTIVKVNSVVIINEHSSNDADVSMAISTASGASANYIAKLITVPNKTNLVLISADMRIYLTEDKALNLQASALSSLAYCISYEVIS